MITPRRLWTFRSFALIDLGGKLVVVIISEGFQHCRIIALLAGWLDPSEDHFEPR